MSTNPAQSPRFAGESAPAPRPIVLAALHAGYSHSSPALAALATFSRGEPFHPLIRRIEGQLKADPYWLLERIVLQRPAVLGLSTYLWNIEACLALAAQVRQVVPDCAIVLGGPEAGPRGEGLLAAHPCIDWVVDGEGEAAFRDLMRWHLAGPDGPRGGPAGVPGLVWREGDAIRRNAPSPLPAEAIPSFLADADEADRPLIYWETARGCPFKCTFCTSAEERLRQRPEAHIEADLACLAGRQGIVKLLDRSFHLGRDRTLRLLRRFIELPGDLCFHLELNPDRVSPEALALFADAPPGRFQFEIGLQTLDEATLSRIDREMAISPALANIRALVGLRRHHVHLDLIAGLPGEDAATFGRSLDCTFLTYPHHLQLGLLKLLPGTPLRRQAANWGYRFNPHPPYDVLAHDRITFDELARIRRHGEVLERLWNSGLATHTLMRLVDAHFVGSLTALLDALLAHSGDTLVQRPAPRTAFARLAELAEPLLTGDPALAEALAWDYCQHFQPGRETPPVIAALLQKTRTHDTAEGRKRLPVLAVSDATAALINHHRLEPLAPGRYCPWPRRHLRGAPVELYPG